MMPIIEACDPDGVALDVGAWFGPWSYWLSRRVESVVAFEPNPRVAATFRACAPENVELRETALSDERGVLRLAVSGSGRGEEGRSVIAGAAKATQSIEIVATTLDSCAFERVRLVKIDVEGYEYPVLRGAVETLGRWHPVVVVEVETRYGDVGPVFEVLEDLGYRGRVLIDGEWRRVDVGTLTGLQQRRSPVAGGYLKVAMKSGGGYVNNVVFAHPKSTWLPW